MHSTAMCMCPMVIPANLDPVCGTDGQTYPNAMSLEVMSCLANRIVEMQYKGACEGRIKYSVSMNGLHTMLIVQWL